MVNVLAGSGVLILRLVGIDFGNFDRRTMAQPMRTEQATKLVRTSKGIHLLNELSAHRERGDLARVALRTSESAEYASAQYAAAIEPSFLASGAATPFIYVDPPARARSFLLRGGLADNARHGGDTTVVLGNGREYDRIVLNVDEAPVAAAVAAGKENPANPVTTLAEAEHAEPTPWLPPLAAGR